MLSQTDRQTGYPSLDKPWNQYYSEIELNAEIPQTSFYEFMHEQSEKRKNITALNYYGNKITYGQLFDNIEFLSRALVSLGVSKCEKVMIISSNTPETIYSIYALNKIGAIPVMEYATENEKIVKKCLEQRNIKIVIILDALWKKFMSIEDVACVDSIIILPLTKSMPYVKKVIGLRFASNKYQEKVIHYKDLIKNIENGNYKQRQSKGEDAAIIVHSGGTTGVPKAVVLSNDNLNFVAWGLTTFSKEHCQGDTLFHSIPPFHSFGLVMGIHLPLCAGCELILTVKFDDKAIIKLFKKNKPNHIILGAAQVSNLIRSRKISKMNLSFCKDFVLGGAAVSESFENECLDFLIKHNSHAKPCIGYGMSELASAACAKMNHIYAKTGSTGIPLPKVNIKIVDPENNIRECKYNETGEIYVSSPGGMIAYLDDYEETEKTIVTDEYGNRWIKSGDLGYVDSEGYVFVTGRLKRIYVTRDAKTGARYKIYPDYVSNELEKNENILESAVICIEDKQLLHIPIAFIVIKGKLIEQQVTKDILSGLNGIMAEHSIPKRIIYVDSIPRNSVGKIDYKALEKMC